MADRSLTGAVAWLVSDEKAGNRTLVAGVANALRCRSEWKTVEPRGIYRLLAPWGPVGPETAFGQPGSAFAPPWPALAIAAGRASVPYLRAIRRAAGLSTYTVMLLDPRRKPTFADLTWVPEHDRRRGPGVMTTLTSPHGFPPERLAALRASVPPDIAALPAPRIAVVIGGPSKAYRWRPADIERFASLLSAIAMRGAHSMMITTSRRTPPDLARACEAATRGAPRIWWDGGGDNPYAAFLAHADRLVVTADSVNMVGEAAATGRPVHVFHPGSGGGKLARFHAAMAARGVSRPLTSADDLAEQWSYPLTDAAREIADEIERRLARRRASLGGGWE